MNPTFEGPSPASLTVLPLTLRMYSLDADLPVGMGALWRSAWGRALRVTHANAFETFFGHAEHGRLVALCPPLAPVVPGEQFEWRLTLFGTAVAHARAVVESVGAMARVGVGENRQRVLLLEVEDAQSVCWQFDRGWLRQWAAIDGQLWWSRPPRSPVEGPMRLALECLTPIALKKDNDWLRAPPSWSVWVRRALGRTAQLAQTARQTNPIARAWAQRWLAAADAVACEEWQARQLQLQRRSARTGQTMRAPTQLGVFRYTPVPCDVWPLLRWMELIQVGAKTAFGCGVVRARVASSARLAHSRQPWQKAERSIVSSSGV